MDKSFNDEELSDIMKEIEALEDNFQGENKAEEKIDASPVMEELVEMDEDVAIPTSASSHKQEDDYEVDEAHILPISPSHSRVHSSSNSATSMNFKVSGDLRLELQFDVGGKLVCLDVNEHGLNIVMEGGMTFSIPLKKSA